MKKGYTLVEIVVVLGILLAIGAVVLINIAGRRTDTDLVATTSEIATLLRQAESDAMAQEGGTAWGVHFSNSTSTSPFYALFSGSYATGMVAKYLLPSSVAYQPGTLPSGATLDVTFSPVTGAASASTSIGLYMPNENTAFASIISISSAGVVSY